MPWSGKQAQAIFLRIKREKGEEAARRFMHKHGHGGNALVRAHKKGKGRT